MQSSIYGQVVVSGKIVTVISLTVLVSNLTGVDLGVFLLISWIDQQIGAGIEQEKIVSILSERLKISEMVRNVFLFTLIVAQAASGIAYHYIFLAYRFEGESKRLQNVQATSDDVVNRHSENGETVTIQRAIKIGHLKNRVEKFKNRSVLIFLLFPYFSMTVGLLVALYWLLR